MHDATVGARPGAGGGRGWWGVALILASGITAAQDTQRWISDQLEVDMRRGQSNRFAIIRMVPSGTAVQLLKTDAAAGYSQIRTPSGAEGWVLSRYLMAQPPARLRVPGLESRVNALNEQHAKLSAEIRGVSRERDELREKLNAMEASGKQIEKQLAEVRELSADTAKIADQNRDLSGKLAAAQRQVEDLDASNRALADKGRRDWFLAGAGVLGAGMAVGLIIPKIRWKKKSSWGRL